MKKTEFEILLSINDSTTEVIESERVKGYLLPSIAGLEDFNFGVHKDEDSFYHNNYWTVSELSTGFSVGIYCKTRRAAIAMSIQKIKDSGLEKFKGIIAKHIEQHGAINKDFAALSNPIT